MKFHSPMEDDLKARLHVYEVEGRNWTATPKIKKIYKMIKKEKHSKIVTEYRPELRPRSLKK